jgi:diguanylate cyclase (GGDEF)-like protein
MDRPPVLTLLALTAITAAFPIQGAVFAIDPTGTMTLDQARGLPFATAGAYRNPGLARPAHPLIVWVRMPLDPAWKTQKWYFEPSTDVGWATLYYVPAGGKTYVSQTFGMRQPFAQRAMPRLAPALRIPKLAGAPLYLRLSVDEESRIVPLLRVVDRATIDRQDAVTGDLTAIALVFIGIFLSLAAANVLVFVFIRQPAYLWYSGWMFANALFTSVYLHNAAWKWLWPNWSLPEAPVMCIVAVIEGVFLLGFARQFLQSQRVVPRVDRIVLWGCVAMLLVGLTFGLVIPSFQLGSLNGRDFFLLATIGFVLFVSALGIAAILRGSRPARFFVLSNLAVAVGAIAVAVSNMFRHRVDAHGDFLVLLGSQAVEGWLLFGALAYRLREIARAFANEQERRIDAQAEALAQARALIEEQRLSKTDALTGIGNRRALDEALGLEWDRCARAQAPLSMLIADVDFFKGFNDTYGHVLGDDCLRKVAAAMAACATRPGDLCARYGGEEFAVVLPETDAMGAYAIAGEICRGIRALGIPHRASSLGYVTASIGVATVVPQPNTTPSVAQEADKNLYRAKNAGRNRIASNDTIDQFAPRADRVSAPPLRGIH